ncbi:MAG: crotonase/enoyl-CoA hydratase family protein [Polyangiales bacterium]
MAETVHEREALSVIKDAGVAEVELRGPGKGNAMGPSFWRELPEVFDALDGDDEVRAVVMYGRGEHFSYGLDLKAMMQELGPHLAGEQLAKQRTDLLDLIRRYQDAVTSIERCRKPVIAALHGWCIGGAIDVAAACDVRLASRDAKMSVREVKVAIVADLGSLQRLPRIVGQGVARELAFTGKDVDADRAQRIGLVNEVHDDRDALVEAARQMARAIAHNPPLVVQGIKRVMSYGADRPVQDGLQYVAAWNSAFLQSKDLTEAMQAFVERREPEFKGE